MSHIVLVRFNTRRCFPAPSSDATRRDWTKQDARSLSALSPHRVHDERVDHTARIDAYTRTQDGFSSCRRTPRASPSPASPQTVFRVRIPLRATDDDRSTTRVEVAPRRRERRRPDRPIPPTTISHPLSARGSRPGRIYPCVGG